MFHDAKLLEDIMSNLYWLTEAPMQRLRPWSFPAYVLVSELIYAAFRSNAKGLLPPSDE
jgi:hypothetical protein